MSAFVEFLASTDNALRISFVLALHGLALLIAGALALVVAAGAARQLGHTGPRWRWFGWFALLKGLAIVSSLALGVAYGGAAPAFFETIWLAFTLPAWLAGANFAWASWSARPAWASTRLPAWLWCGGVGVVALADGIQGLDTLARALAVAVGVAMLATLGGEIRALEKGGRARAAFSLLLAMTGLAGLIGLEAMDRDYPVRFQGWTVNTLASFARTDFTPVLAGAGVASALAVGWWSWMRLHLRRLSGQGWLRRALWVIPIGQLLLCATGFVLLNHLKVDGSDRADRLFAARLHTAALGLDLAGWHPRDDPAGLAAALTHLTRNDPDFQTLAVVRIEAGTLHPLAASTDGAPLPSRLALWNRQNTDDPRLAAHPRAAFASAFMQDAHGTFLLVCEPWPGEPNDWLVARVSFADWSAVMGQILGLASAIILLACVLGVAVVVFFIQRELASDTRLHLVRASAASEAKSELLTRASHELRTPIQGVLGYADLLSRSPLDPRQEEWLQTLRSQGGHLLRLVNDLLDYGALQNGRLTLSDTTLSPAEIAREALAAVRPQAEARGLACTLSLAPGVPAWVRGDPTRLRQILVNLLGNAVKFTIAGSVGLRVNALEAPLPDGRRRLLFAVTDTGPGIDGEDLPDLFDPRARQLRHPASGAGLGLALTRSLCLAMDGDLAVESEPGAGSTFTATVALAAASAPIVPKSTTARRLPELGLRVLVVEDNPALRLLLASWLDELDCTSVLAESGERALELARAERLDAIVLDLGLPGIDGREVARRLRASRATKSLWIVGLSAHASDTDRASALAAGMDTFLSKPVELDALAAALNPAKPARPAPPPEPPAAPAAQSGGLLTSPLLGSARADTIRALARQDLTTRRDEFRAALAAADWPRVAKLAHYLANTADLLGDTELRAACVACEDAALAGDPARARSAAAVIAPAPPPAR